MDFINADLFYIYFFPSVISFMRKEVHAMAKIYIIFYMSLFNMKYNNFFTKYIIIYLQLPWSLVFRYFLMLPRNIKRQRIS